MMPDDEAIKPANEGLRSAVRPCSDQQLIDLLLTSAQASRKLVRKEEKVRKEGAAKEREYEAQIAARELLHAKALAEAVEKTKKVSEREVNVIRRLEKDVQEVYKQAAKKAEKDVKWLQKQNHILNMQHITMKER